MTKNLVPLSNKTSGIYGIHNITKDKYNIGKSQDLHMRTQGHINCLYQNKHHSKYLQYDYNNGDLFEIILIEELKEITRNSELLYIEQYYIEKYNAINNGYNMFMSMDGVSPLYIVKNNKYLLKYSNPMRYLKWFKNGRIKTKELELIANVIGYNLKISFIDKTTNEEV